MTPSHLFCLFLQNDTFYCRKNSRFSRMAVLQIPKGQWDFLKEQKNSIKNWLGKRMRWSPEAIKETPLIQWFPAPIRSVNFLQTAIMIYWTYETLILIQKRCSFTSLTLCISEIHAAEISFTIYFHTAAIRNYFLFVVWKGYKFVPYI